MGQSIQKVLLSIGISEATIKYFFQSTQDKIQNAIINGDFETLQQLQQANNYDFTTLIQGENGLMLAARMNQPQIARIIVECTQVQKLHALIEDKNQFGDTPLMIATINQNLEIVQYLINNGAKINSKENGGANVFMAACASGNLELVQFLFSIPQINVYQKNNDGQTAIHRACFYGEIEIVRFLLKNTKLSMLTKDKLGNTCFHLAAKHLNITLIRYMYKKFKKSQMANSILQQENGEKQTPLSILCTIFNQIKEETYAIIDENQIMEYINNKDMPPDINSWTRKHREIQKKLNQPHQPNQRKKKTLMYRLNLK